MAATVYGTGTFGLTAQTGLFIDSFEEDFSSQSKFIPDADGDDTAGTIYKPEVSWSMSGFDDTGGAVETTLGATITLTNASTMTDFIPGYTTGGQTLVLGVKSAGQVEDHLKLDLSGVFKPFLGAAA